MGFFQAVGACLRKYAQFSGRSTRSEFWWWQLFFLLVNIVPFFVVGVLVFAFPALAPYVGWFAYALILAVAIPDLAVTARRFHDIGRSGWWQLLGFVPILGWVLVVWWGVKLGDLGPNRFGPCPLPPSARLD
jgi:uncharacterized membrane protein YhaH (DUF805 family)